MPPLDALERREKMNELEKKIEYLEKMLILIAAHLPVELRNGYLFNITTETLEDSLQWKKLVFDYNEIEKDQE